MTSADYKAESGQTTPQSCEILASKTRGSGSPFKCVGTGLAQQMSFENDADLCSYQRRIDELEALASSRQKEVCVAPDLKMSSGVKASRSLINIWQWSSAHWDQGFKAYTKNLY